MSIYVHLLQAAIFARALLTKAVFLTAGDARAKVSWRILSRVSSEHCAEPAPNMRSTRPTGQRDHSSCKFFLHNLKGFSFAYGRHH